MTGPSIPPEALDDADTAIPLSESLISFIVAMLAPMFLCAGSGDVRLARLAALETLSAYRMQNQADLMTVAQIVAFGIATLGSLSQSMLDDLSLPMVLRLRTSANALSRSGHRHHQTLEQSHRAFSRQPAPAYQVARQVENLLESEAEAPAAPVQPPADAPRTEREPVPPVAATVGAAPRPPVAPAAFATAAQPFIADIPGLPSTDRRPPTMREAALSSTASAVFTSVQDPPAAGYRMALNPHEAAPAPQAPAPIPRSAPLPR